MRNPDCGLYPDCLDIAARWDISLDCRGCHRTKDRAGRLSTENDEWIVEATAAANLLHQIFFGFDELFNPEEKKPERNHSCQGVGGWG